MDPMTVTPAMIRAEWWKALHSIIMDIAYYQEEVRGVPSHDTAACFVQWHDQRNLDMAVLAVRNLHQRMNRAIVPPFVLDTLDSLVEIANECGWE